MSCVGVTISNIAGSECIGDSLVKINNNFSSLENAFCNATTSISNLNTNLQVLSSNSVHSVLDSPTIDLTLSNNKLSADVVADSIRYSHLASWQTLSASPTLSAEAVQPRLAKAWVNFNGSTLALNGSYNVSSVTRSSTGVFGVNLITPYTDSNHATVASCAGAAGYNDVNAQTSTTTNTFLGVSTVGNIGSTQAGTNALDISVVSFSI